VSAWGGGKHEGVFANLLGLPVPGLVLGVLDELDLERQESLEIVQRVGQFPPPLRIDLVLLLLPATLQQRIAGVLHLLERVLRPLGIACTFMLLL
jgi:hypothetical protein